MSLLKFSVLMAAAVAATASSAADNVTVFRCCGRGETLDDQHRCVPLPASVSPDFVPVIYDWHNSQFLEPNTMPPAYWNMVRAQPPCRDATFLSASPLGDTPPGFVTFLNGSLWVQHWPDTPVDPGLFCLDRAGALVCQPERPNTTKKCCGVGAVYSEQKMACELSAGRYHDTTAARDLPADVSSGFPRCDDVLVMSGHINESHWPVGDQWPAGGVLRTADGATLQPRDYCLELVVEEREPRMWTVFTCAHHDHHVTKSSPDDIRFSLYPLGLLVSVFFLAVTLGASCMLPSTYHVLHWKCQVNHIGCLLVGDLFLAFVQLSGDSLRGPLCVFTGKTRLCVLI